MAKTSRSYVVDLPGGAATTSFQIQGTQTLKSLTLSMTTAAAGKVELSTSSTSQIGTAAPTSDVVARITVPGTAGSGAHIQLPINLAVKPFQTLYVHQTGTGNLGNAIVS